MPTWMMALQIKMLDKSASDNFIVLTFCRNKWKLCLTQYVIELVQVVFPGEDGLVGQHLSQDAAHWPDVNGLGVALRHKHTRGAHSQQTKKPSSPTQTPHQLLTHLPLSWAWSLEPGTNAWPRTRSRSLCGHARGRLSAPGQSHRSEDDAKGSEVRDIRLPDIYRSNPPLIGFE